jgi:hypothetical protein
MFPDPPTDRLLDGELPAHGYTIEYVVDLVHYEDCPVRRVAAWVNHDSGKTFFCEEYKMTPSLIDRLLGRTRPVPLTEHRNEVLDEAKSCAERLARNRADALETVFRPA